MTDALILDEMDKRLLRFIQDSFPLTPDPWQDIGEVVGLARENVLVRVRELQEKGIIGRIRPFVDSKRLGLDASTLVMIRTPTDKVKEVADIINGHEGITHNYQRECDFNIWFTLHGKDREAIDGTIADIIRTAGIEMGDVLDLPTLRSFKIGVRYQII